MKQEVLPNCLLILGCGYVGKMLANLCLEKGMQVKATVRNQEHARELQKNGIDARQNDSPALLSSEWLADCDALLDSIPLSYNKLKQPTQTQNQWVPLLLTNIPSLSWAGYLSSTSVYADSQGAWIDENSTHYSNSNRGQERIKAEQVWLNSTAPAEVFRLAGIYGDERNILGKLMTGNYKTVNWSPSHYSNRIHVDDIVATLFTAMAKAQPGRIINVSDDAPCSHRQYVTELAKLVGAPSPVTLSPEQAAQQKSQSYLDFFSDNKRISNRKLHQELLPDLKYPSFRDAAILLKKNFRA